FSGSSVTVSDFRAFVAVCLSFVIRACGVYLSLPGLWCLFFVAGTHDSVSHLS
ncbi:11470_t:CDS:2, partial [Gigaspora rosea]